MNLKLKAAIIEAFGSQIVASRQVKIPEYRLSRIVNGHAEPTLDERIRLERVLGKERVEQCFDGSSARPV